MSTEKVAVLAGTQAEFLLWQRQNPEVSAIFCDRWPMFAGLEFHRAVEIGTFRLRPDALDLWQRVAPRVRLPSRLSRGVKEARGGDAPEQFKSYPAC